MRFKLRCAAEFAHIAMADQKTPYGELNVRWAHVDPNPLAKEFDRRADEALAQYAIAKRIQEMTGQQQHEWAQMQMVQNGIYPTGPAPQQQQQQQQHAAIDSTEAGAMAAGGFANRFAQYWSQFYAKKMAERFGLPMPQPLPVAAQPQPAVHEAPGAQAAAAALEEGVEVISNPHTGEVVAGDERYAVNPYSQAPHPYSYRDYGWNRPKDDKDKEQRKLESEKKEQRRQQRELAAAAEAYEAANDPNYHYGPGAGQSQSAAKKRRNARDDAPQTIQPGRAAPRALEGGAAPLVVPRGRGRVTVASSAEVEALTNDEPLVFGK